MHSLSPGRLTAVIVAGVVILQALMLLAFAWPATNTGPREVPVAVAGPPAAVEQVEATLGSAPGPDEDVAAFEVTAVADEAAATAAIEDREVYGAVVVTPEGRDCWSRPRQARGGADAACGCGRAVGAWCGSAGRGRRRLR